MIPPFAVIQWLARDNEEEIRREAYKEHFGENAYRPTLMERLAATLRSMADRLDRQPVSEPCTEPVYE